MKFPLNIWDVSLWLAATSIILLITSEVLFTHYGKINVHVEKKRFKNAALATATLFLVTVALKILNIVA
jgi:hypothetical protein